MSCKHTKWLWQAGSQIDCLCYPWHVGHILQQCLGCGVSEFTGQFCWPWLTNEILEKQITDTYTLESFTWTHPTNIKMSHYQNSLNALFYILNSRCCKCFFVRSQSIKIVLLQHEPESFGILWELSFNNEKMWKGITWGYAQEKKLQSATSADSWDRQPQQSTFNPQSWKKRWVGDSPSCQMWRFNSHVDRDSVAPVTKQTETCASSRCWLHMTVG